MLYAKWHSIAYMAGINFVTVEAALSGLTWCLSKGQTGSLDVIGLDKA